MQILRTQLNELMRQHGITLAEVRRKTIQLGLNNGDGFSWNMVWRVLRGEGESQRFNSEIIKVAIDLVEIKKKEAEEYENKFSKLVA